LPPNYFADIVYCHLIYAGLTLIATYLRYLVIAPFVVLLQIGLILTAFREAGKYEKASSKYPWEKAKEGSFE
jgi:hypothetical protein